MHHEALHPVARPDAHMAFESGDGKAAHIAVVVGKAELGETVQVRLAEPHVVKRIGNALAHGGANHAAIGGVVGLHALF